MKQSVSQKVSVKVVVPTAPKRKRRKTSRKTKPRVAPVVNQEMASFSGFQARPAYTQAVPFDNEVRPIQFPRIESDPHLPQRIFDRGFEAGRTFPVAQVTTKVTPLDRALSVPVPNVGLPTQTPDVPRTNLDDVRRELKFSGTATPADRFLSVPVPKNLREQTFLTPEERPDPEKVRRLLDFGRRALSPEPARRRYGLRTNPPGPAKRLIEVKT